MDMQNKDLVDYSKINKQISVLIKKTEVIASEEQIDKLANLVILLCKWNKALNLTAIREPEKMVVLHILDSAVISPLIQGKGNNIADVGTGAGFPGLVLAILNPEIHFTLIDSVAKKLSFVRTAMTTLKLDNVSMSILSMGMSSDYYEAILEGATMVRIGSALFGARNYT